MMETLTPQRRRAWCDGFIAQLKRTRAPDRVLVKIA